MCKKNILLQLQQNKKLFSAGILGIGMGYGG